MGIKAKLQKLAASVGKPMKNDAGMLDIIYIAVYLGIAVAAGAIIIFITDNVVTITGVPTNVALNNSSNNLLETMETGYSFLPIVAVAAIGAVAIGYVFGLIPGQGKGGGGMV